VADLHKHLDSCSLRELDQYHRHARSIVEHNFRHFYGGDFEKRLWQELSNMLAALRV